MLQAYMDDSGTHEGSHACVVAGYFGGARRWAEFETKWRFVLEREGVSEFHARRFWKRTRSGQGVGEYAEWSRARLEGFLDRLLRVIEGTRIYPFAGGVLRDQWQNLSVEEKKVFAGGQGWNIENASTNPIYLPFQYCVIRASSYCKLRIGMHFFLDGDRRTNPWAAACYNQIKRDAIAENDEDSGRCLGGLSFADSRCALPLQAADLLAYEAARYCRDARGNPAHPTNPVYARALRNMRSREDFWLFDRARLQILLSIKDHSEKN